MIQAVRSGMRSLARSMGLHVTSVKNTIEHKRIQIIQENSITLVLDVGANRGTYGLEIRRSGYTGRLVSFEPISSVFSQLKACSSSDAAWECRQTALGSEDGKSEIHISQNFASSSLLPITDVTVSAAPYAAYVKTET